MQQLQYNILNTKISISNCNKYKTVWNKNIQVKFPLYV